MTLCLIIGGHIGHSFKCYKIMARVRRTGGDNRIIVRNSKVYASLTHGGMGALFALRALKKGDILAQYTGPYLD
jgi:hypothetical protein